MRRHWRFVIISVFISYAELDLCKRLGRSETQCSAIHTGWVPSTTPHWVAGGLLLVNPLTAVCGLPSALEPPLSTVIGVHSAADFPVSVGGQQ